MGTNGQHISKRLPAIILAAVCFLVAPLSHSSGQPSTHALQPAPAPEPAEPVSAAQVIAKSAEVSNLLTAISGRFGPSAEIQKIQESLPRTIRQIDLDYTDTLVTLGALPPLTTIQAEQVRWQERLLLANTWLAVLTQRAVDLRAARDALARTARAWEQTREAVQAEQAPPAILQQVAATLSAIEAAQAQLKSQEARF